MRKKLFIAVIVISLVICAGLLLIWRVKCHARDFPPDIPIYPGSILTEEVSSGTRTFPIKSYQYTSPASPDEIVSFYEDKGRCLTEKQRNTEKSEICLGEANPFGEYFVGINVDSYEQDRITKYMIEVHWRRCTSELT